MTKSVVKVPDTIKLGTITGLIEGAPGKPGTPGDPGPEGKNAFEVWLAAGNTGTIEDYFEAQRGKGLVNKGVFAMGSKYSMNDYVTAAGSSSDSAIFFCKSTVEFTATTQPRTDTANWTELVAPAGADGKPAEQRVNAGVVQWRVQGTGAWHDLYLLEDMKGPPGEPGKNGEDGRSFSVDATGPTSAKPTYDTEPAGFAFLDTTTGFLYLKNSDTSGDWSDGIPFKGDPGKDGPAIELQKGATTIQWRVVGATAWRDLIPISDLVGNTGKSIELQKGATYIQWRVVGDTAWTNLILISDLVGAKGADGSTWLSGSTGPEAAAGKVTDWYLNKTTGEIYLKTAAATWTLQLTLPLSSSGSVWLLLTADPTTQGSDGQWALNSANGTIWNKGGTTWNKVLAVPTFATEAQAKAATSYDLLMSPARVREYLEQFGITAAFTTTKTDLNLSVKGEFFNYNATTLHIPGTGGYGRGITIPSGDGYATQFAIENDSHKVFIRYQTAGAWDTTWVALSGGGSSVSFATTEEAQAATALDKAMSPARTREYMEQYGITASYVPVTANLNTVVKGQMFNWDNTTTNTPVAGSYGRGICIPAGSGYVTQLGIINDTGKMYVRFQSGATTWSAWILVGPSAGGGGGGTTISAAYMPADKTLNTSSEVAMGFTGTVLPVNNTLYAFKAVIKTQGPAGATFAIKMTNLGVQDYRIDVRSPNATGIITSSVSTQAGVAATGCTGAAQDGITVIEGEIQFNYVGGTVPDLTIKLLTGDWGTILKNSTYTLTPIAAIAAT